jgi:hypothetical protein
MSTDTPILISATNLSLAWARAFLRVAELGHRSLKPMLITVGGFKAPLPPEHDGIRTALDARLLALDKNSIDVTAMTIFPYKPWIRRQMPNHSAFRAFCIDRFLPRLKRLNAANQKGTYFERMMAYTGHRRDGIHSVDQLEFVIGLLGGNRRSRESALQIGCFDPAKDHTGQAVRGFPCLQQVGISYGDDETIAVNAFYPTQYIFDRAYGNYLGLCQLGHYLARETGLTFARLNCFVGKPELGKVNKRDMRSLATLCASAINEASTAIISGSDV